MYHWYLLYQKRHEPARPAPEPDRFVAPGTPGFDRPGEQPEPDDRILLLGAIELLPILGGTAGAFWLRPGWLGAVAFFGGIALSALIAYLTRHHVPAPPLYSVSDAQKRS
jgi:hypothetical protein